MPTPSPTEPGGGPPIERDTQAERRSLVPVALLAAVLAVGIGAVVVAGQRRADEQLAARQAEVEARGAEVMPFDQDATTHRFETTDTGGIQTVAVNDPGTTPPGGTSPTDDQVAMIRAHLAEEQARFAAGDFRDPTAIHGTDMPGTAELAAAARAGTLTIHYEDVPGGARLTYATDDPAVAAALHRWFDAQLADHGTHATG